MGGNTTPVPKAWPAASCSDSEPSIVVLPVTAVTAKPTGGGG